MKTSLVIFLTVVIFNLDFTKSKPHHQQNQSKEVVEVPFSYFNAFSSFTQRQLSSPSYLSSVLSHSQPRVTGVSSNSFSIGSLYAAISEKPFDVETQDIVKTLDVPPAEKAIDVYSTIQEYLNQDGNTVATSALFTSSDNVKLSNKLEKFIHSQKNNVGPFENSSGAAEKINSYVANHTDNLIVDQLLPTQDVPFYSSTAGVLVNTLSAQYKFPTPFTPGPNMEFRVSPEEALSVETLEMASVLKYHEGRETIVVLPLENPRKRLILVKPDDFEEFTRKYLDNFVEYLNTISSHPLLKIQYFKERNVRVQVPIFNLTVARKFSQEYEVQRKVERSTSAICDTATDHTYFLQTPVQVSTTRLSAKSVDLAVAIGVQIDNVKEYRKIFGASDPVVSNSNNNNSLISITEIPSARLDLVKDAVALPEPEPESEPLADEAGTEAVSVVTSTSTSPSTLESEKDAKTKTNTNTKSKLPIEALADDGDVAVAPAEPEPEPQPLADDTVVAAPVAEPEPLPIAPEKSIFASKLRSELDLVKVELEREQKIHVHVHSPFSLEEPMQFSRSLSDDSPKDETSKDTTSASVSVATSTSVPTASGSLKTEEDDQSQINVVFDSPFYMGIFDEAIGVYSFLAVKSPYASAPVPQNVNVASKSGEFSEYEKLKRWACIAPPAPVPLSSTTF